MLGESIKKEWNIVNMINDYCKCKGRTSITIGYEDDFGYWDVCTNCGKKIEGGYHHYNHYDGAD